MEAKYSESILFALIIGLILSITLLIISLPIFFEEDKKLLESNLTNEETFIENCRGLNLTDTAYCLRDKLKTIYKYNLTDDRLNLTFGKLIERGGDCRDYAFLYSRLANKLNSVNNLYFNVTTVSWGGISGAFPGHRFAAMWDNNGYCFLDQLSISCGKRLCKLSIICK